MTSTCNAAASALGGCEVRDVDDGHLREQARGAPHRIAGHKITRHRITGSKITTGHLAGLLAATSLAAMMSVTSVTPASAAVTCAENTTTTPGTTIVTCTGDYSPGYSVAGAENFDVTAAAGSTITALGSIGLYALSEGAAGGFGGFPSGTGGIGGSGGSIDIKALGTIATSDNDTHGVSAVSQSGGGGFGGSAFFGGTGGTGGVGGQSGPIHILASGVTTTSGDASYGLYAWSLGGAGGFGGLGSGGGGGVGGVGGAGGTITINASGTITTSGADAYGVHAKSQGAQGGSGGEGYFYGGSGGKGGAGGSVSIIASGTVTTTGDAAHGIYALSEGGIGGGLGFNQQNSTYGGYTSTGGMGGSGGAVSVSSSRDIAVGGVDAHGIYAKSVGGAGGAGNVAGVGGAADVTISGGRVQGGSGTGAGVRIDAGTSAKLVNKGRLLALSGLALDVRGSSALAENQGTIDGNATLAGSTTARFDNKAGGIFNSGGTVNLAAGTAVGELRNAGTVSPGGTGTIQTTALTGNYVQSAGGTLAVDADWPTGTSDKLAITGTAELAGKVVANPIAFPTGAANKGLTKTFTILTATVGVTNNGITVADTAAVDYTLLYPDANTLNLQAVIDFAPSLGLAGLTPNQTSVGTNLNQIVTGGGSLGFMGALMSLPTTQGLANALDQLSPIGNAASFSSAMTTDATFAQQLLSCRSVGDTDDSNRFIREGQCLWVRANVRDSNGDGGANGVGFDETSSFYSAGAQFNLGGAWRLGAGIGFEDTNLTTDSNAQSDGDVLHLGGVIKYNPGPWLFAAALTGAHGWYDNTRYVSFGGFNNVATSDTESNFISGRLTGAYLVDLGHAYLKPQLDLAVTNIDRDGYTESGGGGIALRVDGMNDTVFTISPSVELGTEIALSGGGVVRPFVRGGVTWFDSDTFITTASFIDAGPGISPFAIATSIDDVVADVAAGLDLLSTGGIALRLQYDGHFGEEIEQHAGSAKLSVPF